MRISPNPSLFVSLAIALTAAILLIAPGAYSAPPQRGGKAPTSGSTKCMQRCSERINGCFSSCVGGPDSKAGGAGGRNQKADTKCMSRCQEELGSCMNRCSQ